MSTPRFSFNKIEGFSRLGSGLTPGKERAKMNRTWYPFAAASFLACGVLTAASCSDPTGFPGNQTIEIEGEETCGASAEWAGVGTTPDIQQFRPLPHPDAECPFYRGAWQGFLLAGQPDANGDPMVKSFPTIDDIFDPGVPLVAGQRTAVGVPHGTATRSWLGDIKQAGERFILTDQNNHTIYYGIHTNKAFVDFINANGLRSAEALRDADPNLFFPGGIVEYKSAWQWVDADPNDENAWDSNPDLQNYIATRAWVPTVSQDPTTMEVTEDRNHPRLIWVRLLAIHSVFTLPGHPEFIWGSMEHTDFTEDMLTDSSPEGDVNAFKAHGLRNVAPLDPRDLNPDEDDPFNKNKTDIINGDYILFKSGTALKDGNIPIPERNYTFNNDMSNAFTGQAFDQATSVYRMYPGSKSNTTHPDDAITSLNFNVQSVFVEAEREGRLHPRDKRGHYRLVGAQWLDKPRYFTLNSSLQNDDTSPLLQDPTGQDFKDASQGDFQDGDRAAIVAAAVAAGGHDAAMTAGVDDIAAEGSDSAFAITAGEDRLSSTAMESFTQRPASFQNCFSCHNTQAINSNGVPCDKDPTAPIKLLDPKKLNVSHVLSQFLLEECQGPEASRPAFCGEGC